MSESVSRLPEPAATERLLTARDTDLAARMARISDGSLVK